ncbi:MAG: hypothetical protein OQJ81_04865 [Melioribacteraceae bacterium]|nr:hypothetical protein [Melioribacteraceae bacterium]
MEENLTPENSFSIINKAISNYKMNYKENAKTFLLWGWILTLANLSNYIILKILHARAAYELMGLYSFGNWAIFISIGFIIQYFMLREIIKAKKVFSYLDDYMTKLWWATAAGFFVAIFICIKLEIAPPPIMLLIAGIATTTSGLLIKFKPLVIGGISFFIFSIATTFVTNENIALVTGASIICGYLIPGYFLKSAKE